LTSGARESAESVPGWSGGFRTELSISATEATSGYLPGPVAKGTGNVELGPSQVCEQGLDYTVAVPLDFGSERAAGLNTAL